MQLVNILNIRGLIILSGLVYERQLLSRYSPELTVSYIINNKVRYTKALRHILYGFSV